MTEDRTGRAEKSAVRTRIRGGLEASLAIAALLLAACANAADEEGGDESGPAIVEPLEGKSVSQITLTDHAAERLGIATAPVEQVQSVGGGSSVGSPQTSVPASAVIYDAKGRGWVYTSPEPLVFVRERIVIDSEVGRVATLSAGPRAGTMVVTVGAQELWGTEYEVGED
jgi:hypothetical protein